MKFLRHLSDRWVDLYTDWWELKVIRSYSEDKLKSILEFYDNSDFPQKANLIWVDKYWRIIESYIHGDLLVQWNIPNCDSFSVGDLIIKLYNNKFKSLDWKNFLLRTFNEKISSFNFKEEDLIEIKLIFTDLINLFNFWDIDISWTHWDLKWDNIIFNSDWFYLIDWEWCKKWSFVEDVQKFISNVLKYDKVKTDDFLNYIFKDININWWLFVFLETFYFFLNQVLQFSKNRITLDELRISVWEKINAFIKASIFTVDFNWRKVNIATTTSVSDIFCSERFESLKDNYEHSILNENMNNQEQRLEIAKALMLKNKDFIVLHWVCARLINGKNILIWWLSWTWKTYVYKKLVELWLVDMLFDEDLIILNSDWWVEPLWKKSFMWNFNWNYIYQELENISWWIDIVFYIHSWIDWFFNSRFNSNNILDYLLHERYCGNPDLEEHYKSFYLPNNIQSYILWNRLRDNDFKRLAKILWKSE